MPKVPQTIRFSPEIWAQIDDLIGYFSTNQPVIAAQKATIDRLRASPPTDPIEGAES